MTATRTCTVCGVSIADRRPRAVICESIECLRAHARAKYARHQADPVTREKYKAKKRAWAARRRSETQGR